MYNAKCQLYHVYRIHTSLECVSAGLHQNKTKKLVFCHSDKGRGVMADEDIQKGDFVVDYKYSKSYPRSSRQSLDEDYSFNGEGEELSYNYGAQPDPPEWLKRRQVTG